jgi:hypothetical protein
MPVIVSVWLNVLCREEGKSLGMQRSPGTLKIVMRLFGIIPGTAALTRQGATGTCLDCGGESTNGRALHCPNTTL